MLFKYAIPSVEISGLSLKSTSTRSDCLWGEREKEKIKTLSQKKKKKQTSNYLQGPWAKHLSNYFQKELILPTQIWGDNPQSWSLSEERKIHQCIWAFPLRVSLNTRTIRLSFSMSSPMGPQVCLSISVCKNWRRKKKNGKVKSKIKIWFTFAIFAPETSERLQSWRFRTQSEILITSESPPIKASRL